MRLWLTNKIQSTNSKQAVRVAADQKKPKRFMIKEQRASAGETTTLITHKTLLHFIFVKTQ
jgi:hypothetical protein